jgi:small subunit ribosomal protein S4e
LFPSGHKKELSLPLLLLLRDIIKIARTTAEVKEIINNQKITVDNKRVTELKYGVGLFDVIGIEALKKYYRVILAEDGVLSAVEIPENEINLKPLSVAAKKMTAKGKLQITLLDGSCVLLQKDVANTISVGDSVLYNCTEKKIADVFKYDAGNYVCVIEGKNIGSHGVIESVANDIIVLSTLDGKKIQTLKKYALLVGKKQPAVKIYNERTK